MASESEYDTCPICAEKRRKVTWVTCPKCSASCCRGCTKRFLLEHLDINPICMACKAQWDFEFLAENTDEEFHNHTYRDYRAKIIVDRERSLLPATQPYVEKTRLVDEKTEEISKILEQIREHKNIIHELTLQKRKINNEIIVLHDEKHTDPQTNIRFIGHCPQPECKGFLNETYDCGLCKNKACRSCRLPKHKGDCDKDTVETVRLLAQDTRACPNCGVPIFRISGCDQIFCIKCFTAFDWKTGKIETGRIHNPHYYEWLRQNGGERREPGDVRCGGQISSLVLHEHLQRNRFSPDTIQWVMDSHRISGHIRNVEMPVYRIDDNVAETNRDLRIKYLLGKLSDKDWVSQIKKREKQREKNRAISLVLNMFVDTLDDLHANITRSKEDEIDEFLVQMKNLQKYTKKALQKISNRFKNKVLHINKYWHIQY